MTLRDEYWRTSATGKKVLGGMAELHQRGVPWQWASRAVVLGTGVLTKLFLQRFQKVQVDGLENFVRLVEGRAQRSLLTGKTV